MTRLLTRRPRGPRLASLAAAAVALAPLAGCQSFAAPAAERRFEWAHRQVFDAATLSGMTFGVATYPATLALLPITIPLALLDVASPLGDMNGVPSHLTWVYYPTFIVGVSLAYAGLSPLLPLLYAVAPADEAPAATGPAASDPLRVGSMGSP